MSVSNKNTEKLEKQLFVLQDEVDALRKSNSDLEERLKAYSSVNSGQLSLINKLIDDVPFGVMLLDENNLVIHANAAAGKIFSVPVSEMKGQHCNHFFKSYEKLNIFSTLISDKEIKLEQINCTNNDKYILHSAFISDEGSGKVVVETFIDITEIKQAEKEQLEVSKIKEEFLGMISHELRTPLNVIQGYNSLLEEELKNLENTAASKYIENINIAGEMLLHVVNNLIELSDLAAGKIKVDNIPIDLDMIVTQLKYQLEKSFEEKNNTFVIQSENIKPFKQDLALLMKVLHELLLNANKFTENGKVNLSITLHKREAVDWLCFEITDTGCGMSDETIQKIFSAFSQADSSLTRSYEGLGLGLTLVEKCVNLIKGDIDVDSELGKGSRFSIWIPYTPVTAG